MSSSKLTEMDFLNERWFRDWVENPDNETMNKVWEAYIKDHPEYYQTILEARQIMTHSMNLSNFLSNTEKNILWERINHTINLFT